VDFSDRNVFQILTKFGVKHPWMGRGSDLFTWRGCHQGSIKGENMHILKNLLVNLKWQSFDISHETSFGQDCSNHDPVVQKSKFNVCLYEHITSRICLWTI